MELIVRNHAVSAHLNFGDVVAKTPKASSISNVVEDQLSPEPWGSNHVATAIREISGSQHLVLLVGAGVSINRGIPGWNDLLTGLLEMAVRPTPRMVEAQEAQLAGLLRSEAGDPMSVAQFLYGFKGEDWVVRNIGVLFNSLEIEQSSEDYLTALAFVVAAREFWGLRTTIITTNFDDILERELNQAPDLKGDIVLTSVFDKESFDRHAHPSTVPTELPIFHVHGFVAKDGRSSHIVLTLEDFAGIDPQDWTEAVFEEAQTADVWLSVGMSLTDLHVLKHVLSRSKRSENASTYALMARHSRNEHKHDKDLFFYLEKSIVDGYGQLGVTPVFMNWYGDLAMFLDEIFLATGAAPDGEMAMASYSDRRNEWMDQVDVAQEIVNSGGIRTRETRLSHALRQVRESVAKAIREQFNSTEAIKVEYWELIRDMDQLECVASSDGLRYDDSTRSVLHLAPQSNWAAVKAVQSGLVSVEEDLSGASRWKTFSAWPLRLWQEPYYGVRLGALVFSSTVEMTDSALLNNDWVEPLLNRASSNFAETVAKSVKVKKRRI